MGDPSNIRAEAADALATRLAPSRGEGHTGSVARASRQALEQEQRGPDEAAEVAAIQGIAAGVRRHMRRPLHASDHGRLHGGDGLPA